MLKNNYGLAVANSIQNMHEVLSTNRCHNYGITYGCNTGCPALIDGDCENINEVLSNTKMTEEERMELKEIYKELI
jgi:hypothetical protein